MRNQKPKVKASFLFVEQDYIDFKKLCLDERTTPTAKISRFLKESVEEANKQKN